MLPELLLMLHISQNCPLHYNVYHMTINEKDKMIKQIMANCDAAMAAVAVLTYSEEEMVIECEVCKEGFV